MSQAYEDFASGKLPSPQRSVQANPYSVENYVPAGSVKPVTVTEDLEMTWEGGDDEHGIKCPNIVVNPKGGGLARHWHTEAAAVKPLVSPHMVSAPFHQQHLRQQRRRASFRRRHGGRGETRESMLGFDLLAGERVRQEHEQQRQQQGGAMAAAVAAAAAAPAAAATAAPAAVPAAGEQQSTRARSWSDEWWEGGGTLQQPNMFDALQRRLSTWATAWPDEFAQFVAPQAPSEEMGAAESASSTAGKGSFFQGSGRTIVLSADATERASAVDTGKAAMEQTGGTDAEGTAGALLRRLREALDTGALQVSQVHAVVDEFIAAKAWDEHSFQ